MKFITAEQEKTKGQFKFCQRCGLYMIESFDGCPQCQTDKYIINADYGKGKVLNDKDLAVLREKEHVDHYYWLGYLGNYEVKGFIYNEDTKVLTLYTYTDVKEEIRTIVDLHYADSPIQLDTFTDEEINEHLLETYEEYVHEDDLPIRFKKGE